MTQMDILLNLPTVVAAGADILAIIVLTTAQPSMLGLFAENGRQILFIGRSRGIRITQHRFGLATLETDGEPLLVSSGTVVKQLRLLARTKHTERRIG
ncbi:hypothetical protein D3C85_1372480 [compost metagenome]